MDMATEVRHECPVCTEQWNTYSDAKRCYESHPAFKAVNKVAGEGSERNLVEIVKRHSDNVREDELIRLKRWLEAEGY